MVWTERIRCSFSFSHTLFHILPSLPNITWLEWGNLELFNYLSYNSMNYIQMQWSNINRRLWWALYCITLPLQPRRMNQLCMIAMIYQKCTKTHLYKIMFFGLLSAYTIMVTKLQDSSPKKICTHRHIVPNLYDFLASDEHKIKYFEECCNCFCPYIENQWGLVWGLVTCTDI